MTGGEDGPPFLPGVLEESHRRAEAVAEQDRILAKVSEFVRSGVRSGTISAESGEMLIDAAEQQHREAVERIRKAGRYLA